MSVFQFRKTPLHRQGDPVENTGNFTCDPRQHESTECGLPNGWMNAAANHSKPAKAEKSRGRGSRIPNGCYGIKP